MKAATLALIASVFFIPATVLRGADYAVTTQADFDNLNTIDFEPGDRIFLQSDTTFSGTLALGSEDLGTNADPIIITSTGTGRATIDAGDGRGIDCRDAGGFEVSNLNIIGSGVAEDGTTTSTGAGVVFYTESVGNVKYPRVYLDQLEVTGFASRGVIVGGFNGTTGYDDVRITNVVAHGNGRSGIELFGFSGTINSLTNVYIGDCEAFHNVGRSMNPAHGIVVGNTDGAVIERCLAYDNGQNTRGTGILAYSSTNVTIQLNESHSNRTAGEGGGGGFAFDLNTTNSVMHYNYSHDNASAGYSMFDGTRSNDNSSTGTNDNVIRYNISENDGRNTLATGTSGIQAGGRVSRLDVYGNTVFMDGPGASAVFPAAYVFQNRADPEDILFANNLFVTAGGNPLVWRQLPSGGTATFAGNNYWPSGGAFSILHDGITYTSLGDWRTGTGQEMLGGSPTGLSLDPLLTDPGNGGTVGDPDLLGTLAAYRLQSGSPMVDAGLDLLTEFTIDPGPRDFFGVPLPQGTALDIGANEFATAPVVLAIDYAEDTNTVTIDYQSESGVDFGVRRSPDLAGDPLTTWTVLSSTGPGDGTVKQYTDNPPPGSAFFYVLVRE